VSVAAKDFTTFAVRIAVDREVLIAV